MAGQTDFTVLEWWTLQRAMMACGIIVSLAEGVAADDEIFAMMQVLRGARIEHPNQFIRELAGIRAFSTGLRQNTRYADYKGPGLEFIRAATAILDSRAPDQLPAFRTFLIEMAEAVAAANKEGGFAGLGARRRTTNEAAAIDAVKRAMGLAA